MKYYCIIGFSCAVIPSILFLLFVPDELSRLVLCLYGFLSLFTIFILLVIAGGTRNE